MKFGGGSVEVSGLSYEFKFIDQTMLQVFPTFMVFMRSMAIVLISTELQFKL